MFLASDSFSQATSTCLKAQYTQDPSEKVKKTKQTLVTETIAKGKKKKMAAYVCPSGYELWSSSLSSSLCSCTDLLWHVASQYTTLKLLYCHITKKDTARQRMKGRIKHKNSDTKCPLKATRGNAASSCPMRWVVWTDHLVADQMTVPKTWSGKVGVCVTVSMF